MDWQDKIKNIRSLKLNIYDPLPKEELYLSLSELNDALQKYLYGLSLANMPLRTRSKFFKMKVCEALGYVIPHSFLKCQPRFKNQNFDTYIQKSNNLQIWNEEISPERRYVIVKVNELDTIVAIKTVTGETLAKLDKTGTLTSKYQAKVETPIHGIEVFSKDDSFPVNGHVHKIMKVSPNSKPSIDNMMSIREVAGRLPKLLNHHFDYVGATKERNRGGHVHYMLCSVLGYASQEDDGKFPDIKNQLIEVKLQTSPTIDLGLYSPDDTSPTTIIYEGQVIRHCDIRYVVFYAVVDNQMATITGIAIGNGKDFYSRFPQFGGKTVNRKIQIPLPDDFFNQ